MEAILNTMNPDLTSPKGAVWSMSILFAIYAAKNTSAEEKSDSNYREYQKKGK